ncbi:diguanylate cyclase [Colwellia sp. C1TZA3]|uniref:sensor domain-containing diguanylate cyclase n=1 Tax=Colwellia sp. C1TZA3 TaxID=2508879 RepID=UPI0011B99220|nr:diguanylate cyclase [Colwellia sp. C1TZA3]TWX71645.1 diguanylate cyclase [Colwellia sp. C1TZA3]
MAIAPIKIALKLDNDHDIVKAKPSQTRPILLALALGLVGALLNSYPIELAYSIFLVVGNLAFIIAAAYLRPALTLLCALLCVAPLLIIWGHPFGFLTFGCEALFVSYLRGRGWYLPTADFLYWLLIGMPLTAVLIKFTTTSATEYLIFSLFKQSINAIFYTALAVILIFVFGEKLSGWIKSQQPPLVKNLKQYLQYILWVMSAFFVVGVCLFLSRSLTNIQEQQFKGKLDISSQYVGRIIEKYVDEHKKAIAQVAYKLSAIEPSNYDDALLEVHKIYPGFLTMLIAKQDGSLATSSPSSLMANLPKSSFSVADRSYFSQAFFQQSLYVSSVFLGRGFGADPIIAISAPIYANKNDSKNDKPIGIVEGSLNLNLFEQVNHYAANDREIDLVLTDENDNVIYAEASLALATLSKFNFSSDQVNAKHQLLTIDTYGANKQRYLYRQSELNNGWKIFVLIEHSQILALIEQQYLTIFISLFVIFVLVILLANRFASTLNRPLAFALKELAHGGGASGYRAIPYVAPTEFLTLYDELQQSKEYLLKQKSILEETVEKRTEELNQANTALKKLANKDSLTGLYNRRYLKNKFSELQAILARNNADMLVAMLDLDHFKKLNDKYGHLMGDHCLKYVAEVMKNKFLRRSDIVARFGGEEFIIVAQHDEQGIMLEKLEELRQEIAQHHFEHDSGDFIAVTISIGVMMANAAYSEKITDWITLADEQLYQAKDNGRDQLSINQLAHIAQK